MKSSKEFSRLIDQGTEEATLWHFDAAVASFSAARALNPLSTLAARGEISARRKLRDFTGARRVLEEIGHDHQDVDLLLEEALLWHDQGEFAESVKAYDRVLQLDPNHPDALVMRVSCLRRMRAFDRAAAAVDEAESRLGELPRVLNERAWIRSDQDDLDGSLEVFDRVLQLDPNDRDALVHRAQGLRLKRDFERASAALDDAITRLGADPSVLDQKGWLHYDRGEYEDALQLFDSVLQLAPDDEDALVYKADSLRLNGELDSAATALREAEKRLGPTPKVLNRWGYLHLDGGDFGAATQAFERVLKIDPDDPDALVFIVQSLRLERDFDRASMALDDARSRVGEQPGVLKQQAWLLYDQEDYDAAIEMFERVLKMDPNDSDALVYRGQILRLKRDFEKASTALGEAEERLGQIPSVLNQRAWLYFDQNRYDEAFEVFERVLQTKPNDADALVYRVHSLRLRRAYKEAAQALTEAEERLGDQPKVLNSRGWLHYDMGDYDEALRAFERVLEIAELDEDAHAFRAASLRMMKDLTRAREVADSSVKLLPDSSALRHQRALILMDQEHFEEAEKEFQASISLPGDDLYPRLDFAQLLTRMNRLHDALQVFEGLVEEAPQDVYVRDQVGWFHIARNDLTKAESEFRDILSIDPESAAGLNGLGGVCFERDEMEEARSYFERVVEMEPDSATWVSNLAWTIAESEDEYDEAERLCEKALSLDAKAIEPYICLGVLAFKRQHVRLSEDYLLKSIALSGRDGGHVQLAALYTHVGRYGEAEKHLSTALDLDKYNASALFEMGNFHLQREKPQRAVRYYRQAASIRPEKPDYAHALAVALMRSEKLDEAERVLREGIQRFEEDKAWRLYLTLSQLLVRRGDETEEDYYYKDALAKVRTALSRKSDEADVYLHAGVVQSKLENYDAALRNFRRCLALDEENPEATRAVALLKEVLRQESVRTRGSLWGGILVGFVATAQLFALWVFYLRGQVSETIFTVLAPISLGLVVLAFLLPWLIKLRLPGLEAELSKVPEKVDSGPKAAISFGSMSPTGSTGPR
jgi:tetratricopeptide (TPR) repeat protein